jgi:hypothetical protein
MITWNVLTGSTITYAASPNNGYINMSDEGIQLTLPETSAVGDAIKVINNSGSSENQWSIIPGEGQKISVTMDTDYSTSTMGSGGLFEMNGYCSIELVCVVADTEWIVTSYTGPASLLLS